MAHDLILGTAGHIDHGKTTLVHALTGTHCDRLPEERQKGITIDLGFAQLALGAYRVGVIDVPGHERLVRNMLAGATGIDLALLVVSAAEGVMPQTREHVEILRLLGLRAGVVALTMSDTVDADTLAVVELEVRELLANTFLADAALVPTAAPTGQGIAELRAALHAACAQAVAHAGAELPFRLAIDRAFVVQGHGTVVTGTVSSGRVQVGAELDLWPAGRRVRVRGLQQHDTPVDEVRRGMRAALNLAGVERAEVERGQELAAVDYLRPTGVLTAQLTALPDAIRRRTTRRTSASAPPPRAPLRHRLPVRVHLGAAELFGTLHLLCTPTLAAGQSTCGQIVLATPAPATFGQPFVVRDSAACSTLGGGVVLHAHLPRLKRAEAAAFATHPLPQPTHAPRERSQAVAWWAGWTGCTPADLVRDAGLPLELARQTLDEQTQAGTLTELVTSAGRVRLHTERLRELDDRLMTVLERLHTAQPLLATHDRSAVLAQLDYLHQPRLVQAAADRLIAQRRWLSQGARVARIDFVPRLSANQRRLKEKMVAAYAQAGLHPPEAGSFVGQAGGNASHLDELFAVCVAEELLVNIGPGLYLSRATATQATQRVRELLARRAPVGVTVAEVRDELGITRKYAVPLCEFWDRTGVTRREGDLRWAGERT
jgi:selenocysteine-specific elongation factor